MLRLLAFSGVMLLSIVDAYAVSFCQTGGEHKIMYGRVTHSTLKVVVSSYPRPPNPAFEPDRNWCQIEFSQLAGPMTNQIEVAPKNGHADAHGYKVRYWGNKIGHDHFVVKLGLTQLDGMQTTATWDEDVEVVAEPF